MPVSPRHPHVRAAHAGGDTITTAEMLTSAFVNVAVRAA
jgi:hypothetical protein